MTPCSFTRDCFDGSTETCPYAATEGTLCAEHARALRVRNEATIGDRDGKGEERPDLARLRAALESLSTQDRRALIASMDGGTSLEMVMRERDTALARVAELEAERDHRLDKALAEVREMAGSVEPYIKQADELRARVAELEAERDLERRSNLQNFQAAKNATAALSRLQPVVEAAQRWRAADEDTTFDEATLLLDDLSDAVDVYNAGALSSPPQGACAYGDGCIHADDLFKIPELIAGKSLTLPTTEAGAKALQAVRELIARMASTDEHTQGGGTGEASGGRLAEATKLIRLTGEEWARLTHAFEPDDPRRHRAWEYSRACIAWLASERGGK